MDNEDNIIDDSGNSSPKDNDKQVGQVLPDFNLDDLISNAFDNQSDFVSKMQYHNAETSGLSDSDIKKNLEKATATKKEGSFSVFILVSTVNIYEKDNIQKTAKVQAALVNAKIAPGSITEEDVVFKQMKKRFDSYGNIEILVPTVCALSKKKQEAKEKEKNADTNSDQGKKGSSTKRNRDEPDDGHHEKSRKIGHDSKVNIKANSLAIVSNTPGKHLLSASDQDLLPTQTDDLPDAILHSDFDFDETSKIYLPEEISGEKYKDKAVKIYVPLSINREMMFGTEEGITFPEPFSICKVEIVPNAYIDKDDTYKVNNWSISSVEFTVKIAPIRLFRLMEESCQKFFYQTKIGEYFQRLAKGPFVNDKEATSYKFNKNNQFWIVVGNDLTFHRPTTWKDVNITERLAVLQLSRSFDTSSFSKKTMKSPDKPVGILPYQLDCYQWAGVFSKTNPTFMKFMITFDVQWKHVSNTPVTNPTDFQKGKTSVWEGGAGLGVTNYEVWNNVVFCNYPSFKMVLQLTEDAGYGSKNVLNVDRHKKGLQEKDINFINKPFKTDDERATMLAFRIQAVVLKGIFLPVQSIKSFGIPISAEYIMSPLCWNVCNPAPSGSNKNPQAPQRRQPSFFQGVVPRAATKEDLVSCLSEMKDCRPYLPKDLSNADAMSFVTDIYNYKLAPNKFNFYMGINVYMKNGSAQTTKIVSGLGPNEGPIFVEGIKHILVSKGGNKTCFSTPKPINERIYNPSGNASNDEQWINMLTHFKVPKNSSLWNIKFSEISIGGNSPQELISVVWAIPSESDDIDAEPTKKFLYEMLVPKLEGSASSQDENLNVDPRIFSSSDAKMFDKFPSIERRDETPTNTAFNRDKTLSSGPKVQDLDDGENNDENEVFNSTKMIKDRSDLYDQTNVSGNQQSRSVPHQYQSMDTEDRQDETGENDMTSDKLMDTNDDGDELSVRQQPNVEDEDF